jgi:hypothetical protein
MSDVVSSEDQAARPKRADARRNEQQGLAAVLQSDDCFDPLHSYFLERLVPVCVQLLRAATDAGEICADLEPQELMRGVGSLCIGADRTSSDDARRLVRVLISGLRQPA